MPKKSGGVQTPSQELKEIEKGLSVLRGVLRAYESERDNPQVLERTKDFHNVQIEYHQKQLNIIKERQEGNGSHIETMKLNIKMIQKKVGRLKNTAAINRLLKAYEMLKEQGVDIDE